MVMEVLDGCFGWLMGVGGGEERFIFSGSKSGDMWSLRGVILVGSRGE